MPNNTMLTAETITTAQIKARLTEQAEAGDYAPAWLCLPATAAHKPAGHGGHGDRAVVLSGWKALEYARAYAGAPGLVISKYADPTEGARTGLTLAEATEIAKEDPGLIWIEDGITDADRMEAREACADAINAGQG